MSQYKSLSDYLNKKYYDVIFKACEKYFIQNRGQFNLFSQRIPIPFDSHVSDFEITSLYSEKEISKNLIIKATARLDIVIKGRTSLGKNSDIEEECLYRYVEIIIKTKFEYEFKDFIVSKVCCIDDKSNYKRIGASTNKLVPYMIEKDLDTYVK